MVDVLDPATLAILDVPGSHSLATVVGAANLEADSLRKRDGDPAYARLKHLRLSDLSAAHLPWFDSIASRVVDDISEIRKASGVKMAFSSAQAEKEATGEGMPRHFDPFWLSSVRAAFPLIAVVNRIDRRDFDPNTCGELRFIYRLAYYENAAKGESRSTLPMFLNVVYNYLPDAAGSCREVAQSWSNAPRFASAAEQAAWLLAGPLEPSRAKFRQIELNMQVARFPSEIGAGFGGQAIYLFRIFREDGSRLSPIPLENTPDVAAIRGSQSLKNALLKQLSDPANLRAIDQGAFTLENTDGKLLSTRALSFSTSGRERLGNRPYTAIFGAEAADLARTDFGGLQFVRSPKGLVERMNNLTCNGCHQAGGTAGFHMLGNAGTLNSTFNQVLLPFSSHYWAERTRREAYVASVADDQAPNVFRPHSVYPTASWSAPGSLPAFNRGFARDFCIPSTSDFAQGIGCASGSECRLDVSNSALGFSIGTCVATPNSIAGHACRKGVISTAKQDFSLGDLYNVRAINDVMDVDREMIDGGNRCGHPHGGVPLGRVAKACEADSSEGRLEFVDKLGDGRSPPQEICAMRGGPQFDECANSSNPPRCLDEAKIVRALLDTCYAGHFCREDYICQRLPEQVSRVYSSSTRALVAGRLKKLAELGVGFCVPNYFVFNMRADGHPVPEGRTTR